MIWGSGKTNGRGPWRTRQALDDDHLVGTLATTRERVLKGDLAGAWSGFLISGIGPAFFTKWFWACTLGPSSGDRAAVILDARVRQTLWRLQADPSDSKVVPRGPKGYAAFVDAVSDVAAALRRGEFTSIDAEKVEWLLFARPGPGESSELCLHESLA